MEFKRYLVMFLWDDDFKVLNMDHMSMHPNPTLLKLDRLGSE